MVNRSLPVFSCITSREIERGLNWIKNEIEMTESNELKNKNKIDFGQYQILMCFFDVYETLRDVI